MPILRGLEFPPIPPDAPAWFRSFLFQNYSTVVQQLNMLQSSLRQDTVAVAGGAGSKAVVLDVPYLDTLYTPVVITSWSTTTYITAISTTGFTVTFGTAAPGGGGTLRYFAVRL